MQTDGLSLVLDGALGLVAVAYVISSWNLHARRDVRWPAVRTLAFLLGLLLIFTAVGSGLAAYDDTSFPAHVIQHLLLMMVAPPLLALGSPVTLLLQVSPRHIQRQVIRFLHRPAVQFVSGPASWVLYFASMWLYFRTPLYALSLHNQAFHNSTHAFFLLVGYLYWQSLLGADPAPKRPGYGIRLAGLLVGMIGEAGLGFILITLPRPLAHRYSLAATHNGGQLFLMGAMMVTGAALALLLAQWAQADERRALRLDARFDPRAVAFAGQSEALPSD